METLKVKTRKIVGTKGARKMRMAGEIPAVLYGHGLENQALAVSFKEFEKVFRKTGRSSLLKLDAEVEDKKGGEGKVVLIKELALNPVTDLFEHIDFYQPRLDEEVEIAVPLVFEGAAPAIKELGGILVKNFLEIEITALPKDLPSEIRVNVEKLKVLGDVILVKDIIFPAGIKTKRRLEDMVVSVAAPMKEEVVIAKSAETVVAAEAGEPKENKEKETEIKKSGK